MQLAEATSLDRKSGGADLSRRAVEGSAVPRTFLEMFFYREYRTGPLYEPPRRDNAAAVMSFRSRWRSRL
jgi:hypothetical protein